MNKQEAIEKINDLWSYALEDGPFEVDLIIKNQVLDIISQIDEPQKPVIPKFVAEWVDNSREHSFDFVEWLDYENQPSKVYNWLNPENKRQAELNTLALVALIVNGPNAVEIEYEKLYTVEIPDPNSPWKYTFLTNRGSGVSIDSTDNDCWRNDRENQLTGSEIKEDFEWAWQWAKGVE